jgi:exodeoxyribonuclease VII small subunit
MSKHSQPPSGGTTYEALYARLQSVVTRLEAGDLPLDESLKLYEQGVHLAAECQRLLDEAELRVRSLQGEPEHE